MREILLDIGFTAPVIHWRGPSPFHFVAIPSAYEGEVSYAARLASYGWGVVPVEACIGDTDFRTSLFPKAGGYLLPLRIAVRRAEAIALGDAIHVRMRITGRDAGSPTP
ncbi:DUF1905 domain-containing protein [Sphingomonas sp. BIUV-7]|uniref:DUF1905 domain-containing protein n=1 Tax=Sphingomonas natans TaxID=3063330 RepID=A0ABT8YC82_9SPHN|nr:DUF1905 domain-containing protein [Sphingomonas sp. BIUV-7]MDO6415928.1 DUF1905 domain-containing protein [Sphingomonas sp. BIUV-7]